MGYRFDGARHKGDEVSVITWDYVLIVVILLLAAAKIWMLTAQYRLRMRIWKASQKEKGSDS